MFSVIWAQLGLRKKLLEANYTIDVADSHLETDEKV